MPKKWLRMIFGWPTRPNGASPKQFRRSALEVGNGVFSGFRSGEFSHRSLVGCPMSYFSGSRLRGLEIGGETWISLGILGVAWAAFVPVGLWVAGAIKRG